MLHTAQRETEEEICVSPEAYAVVGQHPSVPNRLNSIEITPFVGYFGELDVGRIRVNPGEVSGVFTLSLRQLHDPKLRTMWSPPNNPAMKIPVYHGGPQEVWGITAFILNSLLLNVLHK